MINSIFTVAVQEMETPQLFPFPFPLYLGFCIVSFVFFLFRFFKDKKPYQLIMGIAIPLSLALELSDSKTLYYTIGIIEIILILSAFISTFFFKDAEQPVEENGKSSDSDSEEQE